ncbi:MAG: hypothetical protein AB1567_03875 [bacterium]
MKIHEKIVVQITFLPLGLHQKIINFITTNQDIWNKMELEEQQKFIDVYQKSANIEEDKNFIKVSELLPSILEKIKQEKKVMKC